MEKFDYSEDILKALLQRRVITEELYEKCSKPKYIQNLPGDLRSNDPDILNERLDKIQELQDETQEEYNKKYEDYEKAKETEKISRDKILQVGEDMVKVINDVWEEVTDNMGFNRYSLDYETAEFEGDDGEIYEDIDDELISSYYHFYDNMVYAHDEFPEFNQALYSRLVDNDETAPTYRVRMENLIDAMVYSLDDGVGGYFDQWVTDDLKSVQKGIINTIPTEADKMEKATDKVNQIESELLDIRKKQNILRSEYEDTMRKIAG